MKKVCFIASSPIGIASFHKTNFEQIAKEYDVYVIANFEDKTVFEGLQIVDAFPVHIARKPTIISNIKALIAMHRIFKQQRFACFVSQTSNASLLASIAGFSVVPHRIRIFTGQLWANMHGAKRLFFQTIDRITIALNTDILVDGRPQRQYLIENGIIRYGQGTVLANGSICGVDTTLFAPNEETRRRERNKIGVTDDDTVVFTFMGRVNRDKGIFELLEATNRLCAETDNAVLVLIGNMEGLTINVLTQYPNLHIGKNVILYGFTKEPYNALQLSDIFCLPSYREGFGMSAIEAASLSLPVICSDIYGLQDSFIPDVTGLQCKVKDIDSLYNCMKLLCENKTLRLKLGTNGRKRVMEKFNKEIVSTAWLQYLRNLLT